MFGNKNLIYILTSLEAIEKLYIYTENFNNAHDFWLGNNQMNFNASTNLLIAIGEETKKIEQELKDKYSEIKWTAITDLRNRLAHDYRGADPDIIWQIIKNELTPLKKILIEMIFEIDFSKELLFSVIETEYYQHLKYLKQIVK